MVYVESEIDWSDLESNTTQALRFACQQLRLRPAGYSKGDYIAALRTHQRASHRAADPPILAPRGGVCVSRRLLSDSAPRYTYSGARSPSSSPSSSYSSSYSSRSPSPSFRSPQNQSRRKLLSLLISFILLILILLVLTQLS